MEETPKSGVTFTKFLLSIKSPQFQNNAEKIYNYLESTESSSWMRKRLAGACRNELIRISIIYQDLKFLYELRSSGKIIGDGYVINDHTLIERIADQVETDYLNRLLDFETRYRYRKINTKKAEEFRKTIMEIWLENSSGIKRSLEDSVQSFAEDQEIELLSLPTMEKYLVDWFESIIFELPLSNAIVDEGRPVSPDRIKTQMEQVGNVILRGKDLLDSLEENAVDEFIRTLLVSRYHKDNKLFRDIYYTLLLYGRIPADLVASHNNNASKNRYIRQHYIRKRAERMIKQTPELDLWYNKIQKSSDNK